jgi:ABC transporter
MIASVSDMSDPVVEVKGLTRHFGAKAALDKISITIPRGIVFGLVGANGAGKTTLIKHILGLLKAEVGSVRVFGRDPVADPIGVLARVGYVSEEHDLPSWMSVAELMRYTQAFFPKWDIAYAEELRDRFELDPSRTSRRDNEPALVCSSHWPIDRSCWCSMSRQRGLIPLFAATFWRRSSGRSRTRGARFCSHRIYCTR